MKPFRQNADLRELHKAHRRILGRDILAAVVLGVLYAAMLSYSV